MGGPGCHKSPQRAQGGAQGALSPYLPLCISLDIFYFSWLCMCRVDPDQLQSFWRWEGWLSMFDMLGKQMPLGKQTRPYASTIAFHNGTPQRTHNKTRLPASSPSRASFWER